MAKGVVITGGGTGIGRATARAFADEGANVLIVGRTAATLNETADGRANLHALVADISTTDAPEAIVAAALDTCGRIDVLVNNAALVNSGKLESVDRRVAEAQFATNLLAPIFLTQQALRPLTESRGVVVNISSAIVVGQRGWPGTSVYGASKAALDYLTRTLAIELAPRGIRVLGLAPGVVETGVHRRMGLTVDEHQGFVASVLSRIPADRIAEPDEIARWILRLTDADAGYANGIVLAVDGGFSIA